MTCLEQRSIFLAFRLAKRYAIFCSPLDVYPRLRRLTAPVTAASDLSNIVAAASADLLYSHL